jgi:molybdopterin-guanine dinucleotide biosynthesis protein A
VIAAITAGGRVEDQLAAAMGTSVKALAPLGDRRLIDAAIDAARGVGARHVAVIGGDAVREHCGTRVDDVIAESADGRENIRKAIERGANEPLLLLASDMPFVSADALGAFLERGRASDIALPLANAAAYLAAYPGAPPHLTNVGGERVANGSVVYFGPGVAPRVLDSAQALFAARKSLARMAALLGPALLLRFAVRRLRIEHVERRAHALFGVHARAIRDASPALCFDVDTIDDYRYALEHTGRT